MFKINFKNLYEKEYEIFKNIVLDIFKTKNIKIFQTISEEKDSKYIFKIILKQFL